MLPGRYASFAGVLLFCALVGLPPAATAQRCEAFLGQGSNEPTGAIVLNEASQVHTDTRCYAPAIVSCNGHGLVVRGASLVLENLVFQNCSKSITLIGPKASLTAINVTFEGNSVEGPGSVIWAQDANVTLRNVTIRDNLASALSGPSLGASGHNASGHDRKPLRYYAACNGSSDTALSSYSSSGSSGACGSPVLQTSIIHLSSCSAEIRNSYITDNTANAIITAEGSSTETLYISDQTVISHNAATWLLVADSWRHDPVGRLVITTPQPSPTTPKLNFTPPYVTKDLMSGLRSDDVHDPALTTADKALPEKYVGNASEGQTPLRLIIQDSSLTHNTASEGLMWLRLVSTSLSNTNITHNQAGGRRQATQGATVSAAAGKHAAAVPAAVKPPGPCDVVSALHGALFRVEGPAAFDINRCTITSNVHCLGAVIRVTQGAALTSIRSSMFRNNTATALLRVEGRSWVTDWGNFSEADEYLDVIFYAQSKGYTREQYKEKDESHRQSQDQKDRSYQCASWYMANCSLVDNTVFHSLIITIGNRTQYQEYRAQQVAYSLRKAAEEQQPTLDDASVAWWMVGCTVQGNKLLEPAEVSKQGRRGKSAPLALHGQDAGHIVCDQPSDAALQRQHIVPPQEVLSSSERSAAAGHGGISGNWSLALPDDTTYATAVADILSANRKAIGNLSWATNGECSCTLRSMLLSEQSKAARQPQAFPRAPAVLWNSFGAGYLADTTFLRNEGFSHILRMDNTMVTLQQVDLTANNVSTSVVNVWYADVWWHQGVVYNNSVWDVGSVLATESILGNFKWIKVTGNTAGPAPKQDNGLAQCAHSTPRNLTRSSSNSSSSRSTALENASNSSISIVGTGSLGCLSPVWRSSTLENATLQDLVFTNNRGSIVLDIASYYTGADVSGIRVQHNRASGIRMLNTIPRYEGQPVVVNDVNVTDNLQGSAQVGGLVLGAFSSDVGTSMRITVSNCNFSNNTVAIGSDDTQALANLQLQGGGLKFTAPSDDSTNGYLTAVSIAVSNTIIAGNVAAEGGGVWSAWPFVMSNCDVTRNLAVQSGGGMYLRGLQKDALTMGAVSATNTSITGNCARFGGGLACENCRAVLVANISDNSAVMGYNCSSSNGSAAAATVMRLSEGSTTTSSCGADTQSKFLADTVEGAGGGIAANMGSDTSSFIVTCGYNSSCSSNHSSSSRSTAAGLLGNMAETVGGAVYLNATVQGTCTLPFARDDISELACWDCLQAVVQRGSSSEPMPCGVTLYDVAWNNSTAAAGGDLVALAQQSCASSPLGTSTRPPPSSADYAGFQVFSCSGSKQADSVGTPAGGRQRECSAERKWTLPHDVFEFPYQLYVYNTSCLEEQPQNATVRQAPVPPLASSYQQVQQDQELLQVSAGRNTNFTVSYTPLPLNGCATSSADLGTIVLQQKDKGLMVVGNQDARLIDGAALFTNMSLQPTTDPLGNRNYTFSFRPQDGDALLRQVQPVDVTVTLLRCTLGQYMTGRRCVDCSDSGTYSLNYTMPCYPCPLGGNCTHGLLTPELYYYQHDPLVPQIISCPIKAGCKGSASVPQEDVQKLLQRLGLVRQRPAAAVVPAAPGRHLQQAAPAQSASGDTASSNSSSAGAVNLTRAEVFYEFQQALAQVLTHDSRKNQSLLLGLNYTALLEGWRKLQCTPGYTGNVCAQCDPNYTSLSGNGSSTRYGFYLNKCISCEDGSASWPAVVALYFIWCGYLAFGILMQLKAPRLCAVASPTPLMSGTALDNSRAMAALQDSKSVEAGAAAQAAAGTEPLYPGEDETGCGPQLEGSVTQENQWQRQQQFEGPSHHSSHQQRYQYLEQEPEFDESPFQPRLLQDHLEAQLPAQVTTQQSVSAAAGAPASGLVPSASVAAATGGVRAMLVAVWKILTSYVQVVAMVRYLRVPLPPELTLVLTGPDISSFTSFLSLDCLLPGPAWTHPYTRIMLTAVGLPILLFITASLAWIVAWGVQQLAARMQVRRGPSASLPAVSVQQPLDLEPGEIAVELAPQGGAGAGHEPAVLDPHDGPGRSPSSWQRLRQQLVGMSHLVGSELHQVPAWTAAGLQRWGGRTAPSPLKQYLPLRMVVTVVVLCYSCYPLVTSSMLQALACESIGSCSNRVDDPLGRYGTLHFSWTAERYKSLQATAINSTGSSTRSNVTAQLRGPDPYEPNIAQPEATAPISNSLICGKFWRQDYSVPCHTGRHIFMTVFGTVGLFLLGVLLPLLVGVMLWKNRHRLREWDFAQRYSFLYSEYRRQYCYWEVVIIARKLLFLAATLLLPMTQASVEIAYLPLQVGVMLAILFLVCQEVVRPFNSALLNHVERIGLSATALSYSLIVCAMQLTIERAQSALVAVLAALNLCVIGFFLFKIARLLWDLFRAPAARWLRLARQKGGTWCSSRATLVQRQVTSCCRS